MVGINNKLLGIITFQLMMAVLVCAGKNSGPDFAKMPPNLFADDIVHSGLVWWRPYRVIFDPNMTADLRQIIDALSEQQTQSIALDILADKNGTSAFLFPVLAVNQTKGVTLLNRYLDRYKDDTARDNTWLLIIASLGRSGAREAETILEQELDRIVGNLDPYVRIKNPKGEDVTVPVFKDVRHPVVDALLVNLSIQKKLDAAKIVELEQRFTPHPLRLCWEDGLEWVLRYEGERAVRKIIIDSLSMFSDQELYDITNMQSQFYGRLGFILSFMSMYQDRRPLAREILLKQHDQIRESVLDLLLVHYGRIMINQAEAQGGSYVLEEAIIRLYMQRNLKNRKLFAYIAEILKTCQQSNPNSDWQAYLKVHASQLDEEWRISAMNEIKKIRGDSNIPRQSYERLDAEKVYGHIKYPGVYMVGF